MTNVPSDAPSSPRAERTRVGIIGHVSHDKSSLIAALELLNRQAETRGDTADVLPSTSPSEDWPEATSWRDRRPSWKMLKEDARRSNRRGRRRP